MIHFLSEGPLALQMVLLYYTYMCTYTLVYCTNYTSYWRETITNTKDELK